MKSFISKFLVLATSIILILGLFTFIIDSGLQKTGYSHYKEWNLLYQSKINSDLLIMGNSRAYHHVNPTIVDSMLYLNSFNLGMDGNQFDMQYARFMTYYINAHKKPKIILQNIDEWTLSKSELYIREQYIPYYKDTCLFNAVKSTGMLPSEYFIYPFKYMGCNKNCWKIGFLEFFNLKHYDNNKTKGFLPDTISFKSNTSKEMHKFMNCPIDECTKKLFEKYLLFCKQNNITVICFYAPLYKDGYIEDIHRKTIAYYKKILFAYNVPILDYAVNKLSDNPIYFRNQAHLRGNGCDIFTKELTEDVDSILSRKYTDE